MTQNEMILNHLVKGFSLTPRQALESFGCMRLAARINDLRKEGHNIERRLVKVYTRNGETNVAQYWIPL